jgi:hypothetical protein
VVRIEGLERTSWQVRVWVEGLTRRRFRDMGPQGRVVNTLFTDACWSPVSIAFQVRVERRIGRGVTVDGGDTYVWVRTHS